MNWQFISYEPHATENDYMQTSKWYRIKLPPHLLRGGAEMAQSEERVKALVKFKSKPKSELLFMASQMQWKLDLTTDSNPEQQLEPGFVWLLPLLRKSKQSDKL